MTFAPELHTQDLQISSRGYGFKPSAGLNTAIWEQHIDRKVWMWARPLTTNLDVAERRKVRGPAASEGDPHRQL